MIYNTRVSSVLSATRHQPQQERSEKRLARFLTVAEELIAEVGFDAATMTAIAERAGTSIGGLYHYFPDKQAIATALLRKYSEELEANWRSVFEEAGELTASQFADRMVQQMLKSLEGRPAYFNLLAAKLPSGRDPAARQALRRILANAFLAKNPALPDERAVVAANVAVEIMKGMKNLYGAEGVSRDELVNEYKIALTLYLQNVLSESSTSS